MDGHRDGDEEERFFPWFDGDGSQYAHVEDAAVPEDVESAVEEPAGDESADDEPAGDADDSGGIGSGSVAAGVDGEWNWRRRRDVVVGGVASVLLLCGALTYGLSTLDGDRADREPRQPTRATTASPAPAGNPTLAVPAERPAMNLNRDRTPSPSRTPQPSRTTPDESTSSAPKPSRSTSASAKPPSPSVSRSGNCTTYITENGHYTICTSSPSPSPSRSRTRGRR